MKSKNIRITEDVSVPMHAYCHSCDFSPADSEEFTAAELHLCVRKHVENTGHQAVLHSGIKVTFYSLAK